MMRAILALARKDLLLILRDRTGFFFTLLWPLLIAFFFGTIFGGSGDGTSGIPVMIVDEDQTPASQEFVAKLEAGEELEVQIGDRQMAVDAVRRGKVVAYVALPAGFGEASENIFWGEPPRAEVGSDPVRNAEAAMLEGILMKYGAERLQQFFEDRSAQVSNLERARETLRTSEDMSPAMRTNLGQFYGDLDRFLADQSLDTEADTAAAGEEGFQGFQPLVVETAEVKITRRQGPTSAYAITFPQGVIWGMIGATAAFAISLVIERTRGTLLRLQVAPIRRMHILSGKALACFISSSSMAAGLFVIARFIFGVVPASIPLLVLAIISSSIGFTGLMMLLTSLGRTEQAASGIGWAVLIMVAMLGGGMIPLFFMPSWMKTLGHISPAKWSILAMEGAVWRQFSVVEMLTPCGILIAIGVVCFAIGVRAFAWTSQIK